MSMISPCLGVILSGAKAAVKQGQRIGVIATPATANSHAYRQAIQEINPFANVWEIPCPEFVHLIEQNQLYSDYTRQTAQGYLQPLLTNNIDTLIYGCTHYRHLEKTICSLLPPSIKVIDPAEHIVVAAQKELSLLGLSNNNLPLPTHFYVSGSTEKFASLSQQWLGYYPRVTQVLTKTPLTEMVLLNPVD